MTDAPGLRTASEHGVRWYYKVLAEARPQDAMITNAREHKHVAYFCREVHIEHGRSAGKVTQQYGSCLSWPMFYETAFSAMGAKERCVYEIIVDRCLPYLDVEWLVSEMPGADFSLLLALVKDFSAFAEAAVPGSEWKTARISSACNAQKHSYHVVFRTRRGGKLAAYDDNKYAFYGLVAEYKKRLFEWAKGDSPLSRSFFRQFSPGQPPEKSLAIFDMKVYTKNRIFRTAGSCKLKDPSRVFVRVGDAPWCEYLATYFDGEEPVSMPVDAKVCDYHEARRTEAGRERRGPARIRDADSAEDRELRMRAPCTPDCPKCGVEKLAARRLPLSPLCLACSEGGQPEDAAWTHDPSYDAKRIASVGV